jgi:chorismate mutase
MARRGVAAWTNERRPATWHDGAPMRLFALRGATTVERNKSEEILDATEILMREIMARNALVPEDVVSCLFTLTDDLDAQFPAVAARQLGFDQVPLMCAREVPVPGSLPRVIRVLMHYYAADAHVAKHVYLGEARKLRMDLESAQ